MSYFSRLYSIINISQSQHEIFHEVQYFQFYTFTSETSKTSEFLSVFVICNICWQIKYCWQKILWNGNLGNFGNFGTTPVGRICWCCWNRADTARGKIRQPAMFFNKFKKVTNYFSVDHPRDKQLYTLTYVTRWCNGISICISIGICSSAHLLICWSAHLLSYTALSIRINEHQSELISINQYESASFNTN